MLLQASVITPGSSWRESSLYSSIIHAMCLLDVFMSGAGTSLSGPITSAIASMYLCYSLFSSASERFSGSTFTPPLAPPNGMSATAHFRVIHVLKAFTFSSFTVGENLIPPLAGLLRFECWLLNPLKIFVPPESISTEKFTSRNFSGSFKSS